MKKLDRILINATLYVILLILSFVTVKNFAAAVFIAFLLWVLINRVSVHLFRRRKATKQITVAQMEDGLALLGIAGQVAWFVKAAPACFNPEPFDCGFSLTVNCELILVFPNYKYSACSAEEIAKFYRIAKERGAKKIWILSRLNARSLVLFANSLDLDIEFKSSRAVRKFLYDRNMLPEKTVKDKKKTPVKWREVLSNIFIKRRAKYFLVAGLSLAFLSLFSPLKIYYAVVAALTLALGLACLIRESV